MRLKHSAFKPSQCNHKSILPQVCKHLTFWTIF
uniref:Uncharacterized protein n=1 Tax=Arundo donax TaxID=35708 RepID=A0A0A9BCN2_ARUDO